MTLERIIMEARVCGASDIHLTEGAPVVFRINGTLAEQTHLVLTPEEMAREFLTILTEGEKQAFDAGEDLDFAIELEKDCRQRVNLFRQRGRMAATIRVHSSRMPDIVSLGLPQVLTTLAEVPRGLVLVTGPTGSGKSTTLAAMIEYINETRSEHIVTIEDPIEYVYPARQSLIHQREVGKDVSSFAAALRSVLREDPDIILVGEMRDYETISAALTAAETGHLVFSTLHTTGAAQTIDRIIDACPAERQNQIRIQLSSVLRGVITQCLIPDKVGEGRVPATEILLGTDAVCHMIRESKCHQLDTVMQSGGALGMHTMNGDLARLVRQRKISEEMALQYSNNKEDLKQYISV